MSVPSGRQFLQQSAVKEYIYPEMLSYQRSQSCLHVYYTVEGQAAASLYIVSMHYVIEIMMTHYYVL